MKVLFVLRLTLLILAVSSITLCQARSDGAQRFHWNWRDSETAKTALIKDKAMSTDERAALLKALTMQFERDPGAPKKAEDVRIKVADLNGDGVPEIIAQPVGDVCSPTGTCPIWVFQKSASGYRVILKRVAIQNFTIQPTRTNSYFDLVLGMHGSATEQGLYVYQFRQGKYRVTGCWWAEWTLLDKTNLKEPRLSRCFNW